MPTQHTKAPPSPLTERQEARRAGILSAGALLAGRGGFDAVQMREVAGAAEVALGTLYRYFPSKVHLLVAVMEDQLHRLRAQIRSRPPAGATPGERVADVLGRAFRALRREPQLADAMVRALTFADRSACAQVEAVERLTVAIVLDATGLHGEPGGELLSAVRVVEHTWVLSLAAWLAGRADADQVETDIATACRLVDAACPPH
ncbi:TetR family transcriptional regulator [Streptomyces sp. NPDC059506]|uniref:TetR family transcriptional regulator n=1 Tax=Streptomyces TaxID=1883 RepID=UPI000CC312A7|nr:MULTISPECIES: TetR family transcriptional regulator [unclassified Streptomyces]MCZ2525170.1 TetR family transcriptional regulator [Streptomyces sp. HB2AG]PLW66016.1 TetR/AcrR family transcriptional regulator [Streptomyces sp. DJ]QMV23650.1 TetR family transcriptional regulator [Streptomyces sp. SCUT-3]